MTQAFQDLSTQQFVDLPVFPRTSWTVLAEPVPQRDVFGQRQRAHEALTDVELTTIRLGAMGEFENV